MNVKKIKGKKENQHWYITKSLIIQITEGKCLICGEELKDVEIEEILQKELYKEAGICKKCRKKMSIKKIQIR